MESKKKILLNLFTSTLYLSAFSFGGGYAAMPLIEAQAIHKYNWLTVSDFTDLVTIAEMTPGPIAVNSATFVGNQVAGIPGAFVSTIGVVLPSCIFVTVPAFLYKKYRKMTMIQGILGALRPAVVSMLLSAGLLILIQTIFTSGKISFEPGNFGVRPFLFFIIALSLLRSKKPGAIQVMVGCGLAELIVTLVQRLV